MSYVVNTDADRKAMLERIGVKSVDDLFSSIPASLRLQRPLDIPPSMAEMELQTHMVELSRMNQSVDDAVCFLGGGAYDHFIPAVVDVISSRSEYYTAYTPYQAEASQGSLQAFFEYQTMICQLTGMDVANASLYEGGSAVAESVLMAMSVTRNRTKVLIAESVHPEYRQTLETYVANLDLSVTTIPTPNGVVDVDELKKHVDETTLCFVLQSPNFFGSLEEVQTITDLCHEHGTLMILSFDPIGLGIMKNPGHYGVDIAIAEGQCLGNPLQYGGPYLGILACQEKFVRKMPGRLVGETTDHRGQRCWVLTLQTREQHIRREKATSNICTNQGLFALRSTVYLAAMGPQGLRDTAELCLQKAHYAADELCKIPGVTLKFSQPFFKEFTVEVKSDAAALLQKLREQGYHAGLHLGQWYPSLKNCISVAVTEKRSKAEIDGLVQAWKAALSN